MNSKIIIFSSLAGFVLSFLTGFLSDAHMLVVLLRAVVFAVVFGGVAAGVQVLAEKFLDLSFSSDSDDAADDSKTSVASSQIGGTIDITLPEEDLPKDTNVPRFFVSERRVSSGNIPNRLQPAPAASLQTPENFAPVAAVSKTESAKKSAPVAKSLHVPNEKPAETFDQNKNSGEGEFVPLNLGQDVTQAKKDGENIQAAKDISAQPRSDSGGNEDGVDELPDMDEINVGESGNVVNKDSLVSDKVEAEEDEVPALHREPVKFDTENTDLIARAIRTVLTNEQ